MTWIDVKAKADRLLYSSDEEIYKGIEELIRTSFLGYFYLISDNDRYLRSSIRNDREKKLYHFFWGSSDDGFILNQKTSVYMTIDIDKMIYACKKNQISLFDMVVNIFFAVNLKYYENLIRRYDGGA